jgi:hypothetical protein
MKLSAKLGHEVAWEMGLLLELVSTVCVRAGVTELAASVHLEVSAQLSLLLALILLSELVSLFSIVEFSLLSSSSGFTVVVSVFNHVIEVTVV